MLVGPPHEAVHVATSHDRQHHVGLGALVAKVVELDEERKAAMVSNLLTVLCSERGTTPVVNTGTLHN